MAGTLNKGSLVKGTGGSGGGGTSFPIIVTDSGSSLPVDLTGYNEGDTFLNTSDKKIYKTEVNGYELNTNVTNNNVTVDLSTGVASGFTGTKAILRTMPNNSKEWSGTGVSYQVHFKVSSFENDDGKRHRIFVSWSNYQTDNLTAGLYIYQKKLYWILGTGYNSYMVETKLSDIELDTNTEYFFKITKSGTSASAQLRTGSYNGTLIFDETITTENWVATSGSRSTSLRYGLTVGSASDYSNFINGEVYLGDSEGELVIPNTSTLSWDNGTDLTDKTEYADKTNEALYLYENSELVKIGSSAPTVLTDQTSTSMALAGNTIYKWTSALTSLSFASVEVSDLETVLYFTTGGTISFTDSSSLKWGGDGSAPSLEANTIYCISIRNGLAEIDTFGTVS